MMSAHAHTLLIMSRCDDFLLAQVLCKSSGASLGYGFPTMDLDEEDIPEFDDNGLDGLPEQPLITAVP